MNQLQILENNKLTRDEKLRECDETLQELKENISNYIRTGEKNRQLEDAEKEIGKYQNKLKEALEAKNLSKTLLNILKTIDRHDYIIPLDCPNNIIIEVTTAIQSQFDIISVLSQFIMLVSMSKAETAMRKMHKEYDRMSCQYPELVPITWRLYKHPYTSLKQLSDNLGFEQHVVDTTIQECEILFNIRSFENNMHFISLSTQGYEYVKYLPTKEKKYTKQEIDAAVFTNITGVLDALQKNTFFKPKIDDADLTRIILHNYTKARKTLYNSSRFHNWDIDQEYILNKDLITEEEEEYYGINQRIKSSNSSI